MSSLEEQAAGFLLRGDLDGMAGLVETSPALLSAPFADGRGLVGLAAEMLTGGRSLPLRKGSDRQEAVFTWLLARGADPNLRDARGWTALHSACMSGHAELARQLLESGASLRSVVDGIPGATPISWAMFYAHRETAELLAAQELAPDGLRSAAALGRGVLDWVDARGDLRPGATNGRSFYRPLEVFPEWEAPLDRQTTLDEALTWAARNGRLGAMDDLVGLGAGVDSNAYRGTPLLWATYACRLEAMGRLVERGADPSLAHDFGGAGHGRSATALHLAAQFGSLDAVTLLLELGADPSIRDAAHGGTPEDWAVHCGQPEAAELLSRSRN